MDRRVDRIVLENSRNVNMMRENATPVSDDPFNLNRFTDAQNDIYHRVIKELTSGRKTTHWMWFVFPQIDGLGYSPTTKHFAIKSIDEARQYLNHPVLGPRLFECTEAVLAVEGWSISEILGSPDDLKLKSSITLFDFVAGSAVFVRVLDKYFRGKRDTRTLHLIEKLKETTSETDV